MSSLPSLPKPAQIPNVPDGVTALRGDEKQALLKVPANQRAEVDQAMQQLSAKGEELATDLGTLAPDAAEGKALIERMHAAREVNAKVQALAAFTDEQEMLAGHAVMAYVNAVADDIEHLMRKTPQLGERYDKVMTVVRQRREAVAAGMARAKAEKASEPVANQ